MHVVARCNNREFSFTTAEDFELLLARLRAMARTYVVRLVAGGSRRRPGASRAPRQSLACPQNGTTGPAPH